jgi:hypothetical protein
MNKEKNKMVFFSWAELTFWGGAGGGVAGACALGGLAAGGGVVWVAKCRLLYCRTRRTIEINWDIEKIRHTGSKWKAFSESHLPPLKK